jgi:hypothetical protein
VTSEVPKQATTADLAAYIDALCNGVTAVPLDGDAASAEGYEAAADALWKAAVAAFEHVASRLLVTNFRGSWAALRFYGEVMGVRGPFKIVKAEDALYPQYNLPGDLVRWLDSPDVTAWLRDQAAAKIAAQTPSSPAADRVVEHWQRLVDRGGLL